MLKCIIEEICNYIERTDNEVLKKRYVELSEEYRRTEFSDFCFCYYKFFYQNRNYLRLARHLINVERLHCEFEREMLPAFYDTDNVKPTFYAAIDNLKKDIELVRNLEYADDKSYYVLSTVLLFRLTGIKNYLFQHIDRLTDMYFDPKIITYFRKDWYEVFVDCGAYIGDTVKKIMNIKGARVKRIYAFEPQAENYAKLVQNTRNSTETVRTYNAACGNRSGRSGFSGQALGGHFMEGAENKVDIQTIDDIVERKVTFIKMDIEGAEKEAIEGARRILERDKPVLALSVYHKLEDIYQIQTCIAEMGLGYHFLLRHYGNTISEYVLYCF